MPEYKDFYQFVCRYNNCNVHTYQNSYNDDSCPACHCIGMRIDGGTYQFVAKR